MKLDSFPFLRGLHENESNDLDGCEFLEWLRTQSSGNRVALYAQCQGTSNVFVHTVLTDLGSLERSWEEIEEWDSNPSDHLNCGIVSGGGEEPRFEMFSPWDDDQPEVLRGARQVVFHRSFEARIGQKSYFELAQEITIAHGLHWLEERSAWSRLNDEGDVADLVGLASIPIDGGNAATLIWIDGRLLELHLAATRSCLVQMFDCSWVPTYDTRFDHRSIEVHDDRGRLLRYKFSVKAGASFARGARIVTPSKSANELAELEYSRANTPKEFETFIVNDWKNQRVIECSCAPDALSSYFDVNETTPFQISPVFFKPQVLDKYKADREKYKLTDRTIECRNSWYLPTYDVNEAGQVHTYITYLGRLPISEQRYWKSFNEAPRAPISARARKTDLEATWDDVPDGLSTLKRTLTEILARRHDWFAQRDPALVDQVTYPLTLAHKPWDDTVLELARIVVEGLNHRALRARANAKGRAGSEKWGSVRWLEEALLAEQVDSDRASQIVAPLKELQYLRTKLAAHAGGEEASSIRKQRLKEFGHPKAHIAALASQLNDSLNTIAAILGKS